MKTFQANFNSLRSYQCPDWFADAKFGIWSHWGPQSVAKCGDWYARNMYIQDNYCYNHHLRNYGHPSEFGYKDLCRLWKAENFNPEKLMEKYYKAGARYFVAQAMHHDHFFNYDSNLNIMNSTKVGPMKDICGLWKKAAKAYNIPFGITEHLGASFSWWFTNKGCDRYGAYKGVPYDGNDPEFQDFYFNNYEHTNSDKLKDPNKNLMDPNGDVIQGWYTTNEKFHIYWKNVMKEIIDKYEPDLLYSDGGLPFAKQVYELENSKELNENDLLYQPGLDIVSYYYNKSIELYGHNKFIYTQKDRREDVYKIGVLDIEKSQLSGIREDPWQTDSCIGGWFYSSNTTYKKPGHIIEMLIDIISKNGNLLLNIPMRPDGEIDSDADFILHELASWFSVCSEGVYGTRPWKTAGEGVHSVTTKLYSEDEVPWDSSDIRFTKKDDLVFAFLMRASGTRVTVIKSFQSEKVISVRLLGYGKVEFSQNYGILVVNLPEELPSEYANCLAIEID